MIYQSPNTFSLLIRSVANSVQSAIQSSWAAVLLKSDDGEWFSTSADTRPDAPFIKLRHNSQIAKWLESQDGVLRASDPLLTTPSETFDEWDEALLEEHHVEIISPVNDGGILIGVIVAGEGVAGSAYPVSSLNYMKSISDVAGMAIAAHGSTALANKDKGQANDQLIRRMAHDIKGPLATVMTYIDLLKQNKPGNLTDDQLVRLDKATRSGRRLHRLLEDFVDYQRLESGSLGLDRTEFELGSMAGAISDQFSVMVDNRDQELRVTTPSDPVTLWADRARTVQMVSALISNSSRYSSNGTPIDVEMWAEGNRFKVRVSDQGRGMSAEHLSRVFDPFDPNPPSRRSEDDQAETGSGLGLVLARGLAKLHGGKLSIQSSHGQGTVVEIEMPVVLAGESTDAA